MTKSKLKGYVPKDDEVYIEVRQPDVRLNLESLSQFGIKQVGEDYGVKAHEVLGVPTGLIKQIRGDVPEHHVARYIACEHVLDYLHRCM
jgi:hypothetical protein